jgi:YHS domain-containing protein
MHKGAEKKFVDPVCGREVSSNSEFFTDLECDRYYFCSAKDLAEFERDPLKYVAKEKADAMRVGIAGSCKR